MVTSIAFLGHSASHILHPMHRLILDGFMFPLESIVYTSTGHDCMQFPHLIHFP